MTTISIVRPSCVVPPWIGGPCPGHPVPRPELPPQPQEPIGIYPMPTTPPKGATP